MDVGLQEPTATAQPVTTEFTNISLEEPLKKKKIRQPKKILHFSDGVLEEYSTDEEEDQPPLPPPVDPKTLTWGPWMWYYISLSGFKTLSVADMCGEKLAWFFGITTPKYQSAIDEFYRLKHQEEEEMRQEERRKADREGLSSVDVTVIPTETNKASGDEAVVEKF